MEKNSSTEEYKLSCAIKKLELVVVLINLNMDYNYILSGRCILDSWIEHALVRMPEDVFQDAMKGIYEIGQQTIESKNATELLEFLAPIVKYGKENLENEVLREPMGISLFTDLYNADGN